MNHFLKIKDFAEIKPGFSFRGEIKAREDGDFKVLQIKDVGIDGTILVDNLVCSSAEKVSSENFVQKGDVVFTTRGVNRRAAYIDQDLPHTVYVAQIFNLRKIRPEIDPAYLAWYLNQKPAQEYLESNSSGSYVKNIKIDVLAELEIPVPPLEKQRCIAAIHNLHAREKHLIESIAEKRELLIEGILMKAIRNDHNGENNL